MTEARERAGDLWNQACGYFDMLHANSSESA